MSDRAYSGHMYSGQEYKGKPSSFETALSSWRPRGKVILGAAMLFAAAAVVSPVAFAKLTFLIVSCVLVLASIAAYVGPFAHSRWQSHRLSRHLGILNLDPCSVVVTTPEDRIIYVNPTAGRELGARPNMSLSDVMSGLLADPSKAIARVRDDLKDRSFIRSKINRLDDHFNLDVMSLSDGLTVWRVDLKSSEETVKDATFATVTLNEENVVLDVNPAARELLGVHADMLALFCPNQPLKLGEINDIRSDGGLIRCFVQQIDGQHTQSPDQIRKVAILPLAEHFQSQADTWSMLEELPVAILRLSSDGTVELSNRPARVLLGVESGAGRRLAELVDGPGRSVAEWLRDAVDGRGTVQPEILQMRRKDKEVFVQVALNPVRDNGKTVLIAVLQDATKLKSLELQFVQSQKMQAIGQLAGGVAHDFNNLLTAISGHCDLLLLKHGVDDPTYPDLMQISQNSNRAAALVGQLLAYSRKQMLRLEVMSLRDMLSDVTHLLNRLVGEKVALTLKHDPDLWCVRADKRQLEQVLMNLVVNARDAMIDGGEVVIRTENCLLETALKRDQAVVAPGRYVVVSVEDQGVGIHDDFIDRVFEPFYTSKKQGEGTGLGLSTAYGIIKQTGGFIFVDSVQGQGTTFQIYLPAHAAPAKTEDHTDPARMQVRHANGVVMLVEDEAPVRAFACRALKMKGFSVIEAASGEDALNCLKDDALHIDVIVTDVVMPGMDGPTWVAEALKTRPNTRVIFVSGYAAEPVQAGAMPGKPSVFLPKPFSLTELVTTVKSQLPRIDEVKSA